MDVKNEMRGVKIKIEELAETYTHEAQTAPEADSLDKLKNLKKLKYF